MALQQLVTLPAKAPCPVATGCLVRARSTKGVEPSPSRRAGAGEGEGEGAGGGWRRGDWRLRPTRDRRGFRAVLLAASGGARQRAPTTWTFLDLFTENVASVS